MTCFVRMADIGICDLVIRERDRDEMAVIVRSGLDEEVHLPKDEFQDGGERAETVVVEGVGRSHEGDVRVDLEDLVDDDAVVDAVVHLALKRQLQDLAEVIRVVLLQDRDQ